jgi:hypothetical protein
MTSVCPPAISVCILQYPVGEQKGNNKLERMKKKVIMAQFQALTRNLPGRTGDNN